MDELRAAGIEPFATPYHWDLPQALQDRYGGWQSAETAKAFADYAGYVAEQLGGRVRHYFTINEFASFVEQGYQGADVQVGGGETLHYGAAPGMRLADAELKQVRHHAGLGHGLAVQAIRARGPAGTKVGFAGDAGGRYPEDYLASAAGQTPTFSDEELATIASPLDFVGINVYKPNIYIAPSDEPPGYREIPISASHPKMHSSWHVFDPEVMYWAPRQMQSI